MSTGSKEMGNYILKRKSTIKSEIKSYIIIINYIIICLEF